MERKTDRRTLYTKGVIKEAYLVALKTKHYDKITVSELCSAAEINRSTFYLHYADALAVFDEILDELLSEIVGNIEAYLSENPEMSISECFTFGQSAQSMLLGDRKKAFVLEKGLAYPRFLDKFSETMARELLPRLDGGRLTQEEKLLLIKSVMYASVSLSGNFLASHKQKDLAAYTELLGEHLFKPCLEKLMDKD